MTSYLYDSKNDPFYSILGFDKLTFYEEGNYYGCPKNVTSFTYSATNTTNVNVDNVVLTYNSYDFPMTSTVINQTGANVMGYQFFYKQP